MSDIESGTAISSEAGAAAPYRVLARKYRPRSFDDLIGQEPMVRTLTNAFETGRIAQAWMLTGVRGVGKTTTARILARALNYQTDEIDQPTIHMGEPGIHCQAIMEGRHVDVVEMDAASHTGIDDVREIIAQVRYRPVSARYKVYIIDEVHMLSTQAFNGLLKTLEEPPEHVKFVFATTEIRKVPVTVLSRCQRFDLRRVESATLMAHLTKIATAEHVEVDEDALRLIARAAEGSVRDALSLTDQAIAHGAGAVTAQAVRDMLGLADRVRIIDLFEYLMKGDAAAALKELRDQYVVGADPAVVLADLADFTHLVTTLRFVPDAAEDAALSPMEAERGLEFSKSLSIRTLGQVWQMLLKALEETRNANAPRQAAEMALIRIAHAADLPSPDDLVRLIRSGEIGNLPAPALAGGNGAAGHGEGGGNGVGASGSGGSAAAATQAIAAPSAPVSTAPAGGPQSSGMMSARMGGGQSSRPQTRPVVQEGQPEIQIASLEQLVALSESKRDSLMTVSIRRYLRLVKLVPGRIEVALTPEAPRTLITDLTRKLHDWTGRRWVVTISNGEAKPTLDEVATARRNTLLLDAESDPEVAAILASFPGAKVVDVRLRGDAEAAADEAALVSDVVEDDILVDPSEQSDDDDI
ncbi:DNA polymerase III, subunits gamma/tau [Aurantimonas manganoxydans SI85-9A1]|uniref:DNA polymerase III subunit gamma/tau n=2 Tax=Aurantimonas manganoxydans TaxID=651183 RepID=Q1YHK4_AURMS|nr:DNA polymerase III subunit gamma/tau [Aurantimonas manganoxydans]EAS49575.1 DNA polymerase III, subunits gamma/tau [Aurantimonas manganoxydans SI85-9A1]BAT29159.1 DNA polymerase III, subunits gamma/tau [Aurantimonas manganoxydans SI85-9A1]